MLSIQNLTKTYQVGTSKVVALDHISMEVQDGEFIAVVGTSGSGKSTLLHLTAGVDLPTSGSVLVNGQDIYRMSDANRAAYRRRHIGIIYQSFNLISTLTVEENIILPFLLEEKKVNPKELSSLLELLGLKERRKHLPNQLSGGQQQRVAIGRALFAKPSLILADEPTGNLDSKNTKEVLELLQKANKEYHQTVMLVTHDESAKSFAQRFVELAYGKIVQQKASFEV